MKLKRFLLSCDFLGKTQNFTIANKYSYQTFIGTFVSFMVIAICAFFLSYFALELFKKNKPELLTTVYNIADPERTNLTKDNFMFAFSLQHNDYSPFVNESIYTIEVFMTEIFRKENGETEQRDTPIPFNICSNITINLLPDYFSLLDLKNLYCLDLNKMDLYLQGDFGNEIWSYVKINILKCVNETKEGGKCGTNEEISQQLSSGYLGAFISDLSIIPNNYKNPAEIYGKNIFTSFSVSKYLAYYVYYKEIQLITDYGWLFNTYKHDDYFAYDTFKETSEQREENIFIDLFLRLSQTREVYERSYYKAHELAADVGGILKVCLVIGEFISYFFRESLYKDYILSFFYEEGLDRKLSFKTNFVNNNNNNNNSDLTSKRNFFKNNLTNNSNMFVYSYQDGHTSLFHGNTNVSQDMMKEKTEVSLNNKENWVMQKYKKNFNVFQKEPQLNNKCQTNSLKCVVPNEADLSCNNEKSVSGYLNNNNTNNQMVPILSKHFSRLNSSAKLRLTSYMLLGPCLWDKKVKSTMKKINTSYSRIAYLFDVIHYLKTKNDIVMIKKKLLKITQNPQNRFGNKEYKFEMNNPIERDIFDHSVNSKMK